MGNSPVESDDDSEVETSENSGDLPEEILESSPETPEKVEDPLENPDIAQPSV